MIARLWSARTTVQLSARYADYFAANVLPELRAIAGFVSAQVLTSPIESNHIEVLVITTWQSLDAVRGFAGSDLEAAVVHPAAAALLTDYERRVRHFTVVLFGTA